MGQAIASSSLVSPAAAAQPNSEIAEKTFEAIADNVVNALEAAYGVNRGKRRNHTKGFGALGIFVGAPEAAEYSCSQLFSGQEIEVVARFSLAGGDPEASDTEKRDHQPTAKLCQLLLLRHSHLQVRQQG